MGKSFEEWVNKTASVILKISLAVAQNALLISLQIQNLPRGGSLDTPNGREPTTLSYLPPTCSHAPFTSIPLLDAYYIILYFYFKTFRQPHSYICFMFNVTHAAAISLPSLFVCKIIHCKQSKIQWNPKTTFFLLLTSKYPLLASIVIFHLQKGQITSYHLTIFFKKDL